MTSDEGDAGVLFLELVRREFDKLKSQADAAMAQVSDRSLMTALDADSNSIAVLVQHLGGNLRSRWTQFLESDGEKPDRERDQEFEPNPEATREALVEVWESGWRALSTTLASLHPGDLFRTVHIRGEPHSVVQAILRSLTHTAGHVGQIVLLAKHAAGPEWRTLSIPRGQSKAFNDRMAGRR